MRSVELFAGAGGLALGCELAGFEPVVVVEWDRWACDTIRENQAAEFPLVSSWQVHEGDVRAFAFDQITDPVAVVTGGPPCQPFSMGGKARAADDKRDMFPAAIEVVRTLQPKAFIFENVRGLTRAAFSNYFNYILLQLTHPLVASQSGETWTEHYARLQVEHTTTSRGQLTYNVVPTLVNAADYGVPQQRHRVFIVGFRADLEAEWAFPSPTHSFDALLYDQWVTGAYWDRHKVTATKRPALPSRLEHRVGALRASGSEALGDKLPWLTVRDAISDLPKPGSRAASAVKNHTHQPGARSYPGHTGSPFDMPAKALKAGGHGVPGGENMLLDLDGSVRYFTVRESARLQTFPDAYELHGAWGEAMRQLGNAVPVLLARCVAQSVADHLAVADLRERAATKRAARRSA